MRFCLACIFIKQIQFHNFRSPSTRSRRSRRSSVASTVVPPPKLHQFMHLVVRIASLQPPRVSCQCFSNWEQSQTSWNVQADASKKKTAHKHHEIGGGLHKFEK